MKVWITKYALTQGIFEKEAESCSVDEDGKMISVERYTYYHKPFWHETKEDALKHAEEMRIKKIQSLTKQIEKLRLIKF